MQSVFKNPFATPFIGLFVFVSINWPVYAQISRDSARVHNAVEKAIKFLEGASDNQLSSKGLVALAHLTSGRDSSHPKVLEAVQSIQKACADGEESFNADMYSSGISIMCLTAVAPNRYRTEIEVICKSLHRRQKENGAWSEDNLVKGTPGDTSMTQFVAMGLWHAEDQAGIETPTEVWEKLANWILKTQDPSGAFGEKGNVAEDISTPIAQTNTRNGMTAAGIVLLYICKDRLGLSDLRKASNDKTPQAMRVFETPEERKARVKTKLPTRFFGRGIVRAGRWLDEQELVNPEGEYPLRYLYTLERSKSFAEADLNGFVDIAENPVWYRRGAAFILENQDKETGKWESDSGDVPATCFAILFLLRSNNQGLQEKSKVYQQSTLVAGRTLPEIADVRVRDGKVVVQPLKAGPEQVIPLLEKPGDENYSAAVEAFADFTRQGKTDSLLAHKGSLASLALAGRPGIRALAIGGIGRSRNLNAVPLIIHLLETADEEQVVLAAHDALKLMSRTNIVMPSGGGIDRQKREPTIEKWKNWYRKIRPEVDFQAFDPSEFTN